MAYLVQKLSDIVHWQKKRKSVHKTAAYDWTTGGEYVPFSWMRTQSLSLVLLVRSSARVTIFASDIVRQEEENRDGQTRGNGVIHVGFLVAAFDFKYFPTQLHWRSDMSSRTLSCPTTVRCPTLAMGYDGREKGGRVCVLRYQIYQVQDTIYTKCGDKRTCMLGLVLEGPWRN
jgi:hypothetical protein